MDEHDSTDGQIRLALDPETGCLPWTGRLDSRGPVMLVHRLPVAAGRYLWEAHYGRPPADCRTQRRCPTPLCVNPRHRFLMSAPAALRALLPGMTEAHYRNLREYLRGGVDRAADAGLVGLDVADTRTLGATADAVDTLADALCGMLTGSQRDPMFVHAGLSASLHARRRAERRTGSKPARGWAFDAAQRALDAMADPYAEGRGSGGGS